ncbi:hypothetical protein EVAR_93469_1 [Eumeta japonica]|uniref:Uncharacterized protein n=1 Tax=Eumeta variegata TaxID=151549 RepID=A0A4C1TKF9_EUMVA|nr:hypothetical protein EVAR_93469_1 [Eumeta japonica]
MAHEGIIITNLVIFINGARTQIYTAITVHAKATATGDWRLASGSRFHQHAGRSIKTNFREKGEGLRIEWAQRRGGEAEKRTGVGTEK